MSKALRIKILLQNIYTHQFGRATSYNANMWAFQQHTAGRMPLIPAQGRPRCKDSHKFKAWATWETPSRKTKKDIAEHSFSKHLT